MEHVNNRKTIKMNGSKAICFLSVLLPLFVYGLEASLTVTNLPPAASLTTETSTNVPFALDEVGGGDFAMGFDAFTTPSNNVEMAIGCDADGDGVLTPAETGVLFGWRSGRWFFENVAQGVRFYSSRSSAEGRIRRLVWSMHIGLDPRRASICDEEGEVFPGDGREAIPFDARWNLVRLTMRGLNHRAAAFRAEITRRHLYIRVR